MHLHNSSTLLVVATVGGPNDITIINPGVGYTPSNGSLVYSDVPMITETGEGSEAVGNVTVNNGEISVSYSYKWW